MTLTETQLSDITQRVIKQGFKPTPVGYYKVNNKTKEIDGQKCYRRITKLDEYVKNLTDTGLSNTNSITFLNNAKILKTSIRDCDAKDEKIWEFLKNSQADEVENPLISSVFEVGSILYMGSPYQSLTPTSNKWALDAVGRPLLSNFDDFESMKNVRSEKDSFLIGFDAEWVGEPREIISWQFSCVREEYLVEYVFLRTTPRLLALDTALAKILDDIQLYQAFNSADYVYHEACAGFDSAGQPIWERFDDRSALIGASSSIYPLFENDEGRFEPASYTIDEGDDKGLIDKFAEASEREWKWSRRKVEFTEKHNVTIVCHAGKVDLTTLFAGEYDNFICRVAEVQGGTVSLNPVRRLVKSRVKGYASNNYVYPLTLNFRDTMAQAPAGKKSLADLGRAIKIPKLDDSRINKEKMDEVLLNDTELFFEYASRDSTVTVLYASALYGYNKEMALTLTSATANVMRESMKTYLGVTTDVEFDRKYRGIKKVKKALVKNPTGPGFLNATNKEPITEEVRDILLYASESYHGGLNGSSEIGWYDCQTNDFDLQNAYPTAMALVPDIDWEDPVLTELVRVELTKKHFKDPRFGYNPMTPIFARITFSFPQDVLYPTIPINVEGRLIFPRTSAGLDVVYATGPEIYLALELGATVWCERGWVLNTLERPGGGESRSLSYAVKRLIEDRREAKQKYGSKEIEELILKTMVNSGYGKNAQNVIDKSTWDAYHQEMTALGDSAITNPVSASLITSFVRGMLLAVTNEAHAKYKYKTYSYTTDGFIANIPSVDILESFDLYGFATVARFARHFLTDGTDVSLWEIKHSQDELLNLTTRGNMAPTLGGVCAHNSTKSPYPSGSLEDRLWFIDKCLSRDNKVVYRDTSWTTFKDLSKGANFKVVDVERRVSMDFDMKRKPDRDSFYTVNPTLDGKTYEIANFSTVPFESVAEAVMYERKKGLCDVLRTENHWDVFWEKVHWGVTVRKRVSKHGRDWDKLVSCVMGFRKGLWMIKELDDVETTVQKKCDWINSLKLSPKAFKPSDWKNARRPERQANMLRKSDIIDFLRTMGAKDFKI